MKLYNIKLGKMGVDNIPSKISIDIQNLTPCYMIRNSFRSNLSVCSAWSCQTRDGGSGSNNNKSMWMIGKISEGCKYHLSSENKVLFCVVTYLTPFWNGCNSCSIINFEWYLIEEVHAKAWRIHYYRYIVFPLSFFFFYISLQ